MPFDEQLQSSSYSADPSHQWIRSGVVTFATYSTQAMSFLLGVGYFMMRSSNHSASLGATPT